MLVDLDQRIQHGWRVTVDIAGVSRINGTTVECRWYYRGLDARNLGFSSLANRSAVSFNVALTIDLAGSGCTIACNGAAQERIRTALPGW